MRKTTVVFKTEENRNEFIKLHQEYLDLPASVVTYTTRQYKADDEWDDTADNGKPTVVVEDFADELTFGQLDKVVGWNKYEAARFNFDYIKKGLVDFTASYKI